MASPPLILRLFGVILTVMMAISAPAQWSRTPHPVDATARIEPATAKAGEAVTLIVSATVKPEYHIYGMVQVGEGGPIPTAIQLPAEFDALLEPLGEWLQPEAKVKFDKGFERDVRVIYGSPLEFRRTYRVRAGAAVGTAELKGNVYVQACTEESCLPPARRPFTASLTVAEGSAAVIATPVPTPVPSPEAATSPSAPSGPMGPEGQADELGKKSFGGFLLGAFLFGLLALATPCVFPMIPITVTFFTKTKTKSTGHAVMNALVYTVSIIIGFAFVGFVVSLTLRLFGGGVEQSGFANQLAANPWVNLFFAALYFIFALSLFEIIHIGLPSSWTNKVNKASMGRSDFFGIAMKALVFVLISFTCTAPLIGVLIVQTLSGEWTRPLFGMLAFATGFALPFFVLALVPQMLGSLPKAGGWLFSTKVVMALLVIAAAFKFVSNADLVWLQEGMILTREVLLAIWATLAAVIAFYLFGFIRLPDDDSGIISVPRMLTGSVFAALFLYLAAGLTGTTLNSWVEAYLPPDLSPKAGASATAGGAPQLDWLKNRDDAFALASKTGKNVFIDFTGYSCTNCRLMEKNMFPRPAVTERLGRFVRVKLYTDDLKPGTDGKTIGEQNLEYQASTFDTVTLPFYAIVTPEGKILSTAAYSTNEDEFVKFLDKGLL